VIVNRLICGCTTKRLTSIPILMFFYTVEIWAARTWSDISLTAHPTSISFPKGCAVLLSYAVCLLSSVHSKCAVHCLVYLWISSAVLATPSCSLSLFQWAAYGFCWPEKSHLLCFTFRVHTLRQVLLLFWTSLGIFTPKLLLFESFQKVKLSLCLTNKALCHEDVWRSEHIDPRLLDLGTSLRCQHHAPATLPSGKEPPVHIG
jgi:hypothetical protein